MAQPALPLLVQKKLLAEANGSRERCYLQGSRAPWEGHAAAQWAQNELLFSLVLKNKFKD